jgi:hypothetical protein
MGNLLAARVGNILTALMGNVLTAGVGKVLDIYTHLRCFYERLARGKGANKAKVATARRLLTIIYKVLKEGRNYIAYPR